MSNSPKKLGRRTVALLWLIAVGIVIGVLIAIEQIPVLYLLATLALVALRLRFAYSEVESFGRGDHEEAAG